MSHLFSRFSAFIASPQFIHAMIVVACILIALIALALWLGAIYLGWRLLQKRKQVSLPVYLENRSNLEAAFWLSARFGRLEKRFQPIWMDTERPLELKRVEKTVLVEPTPQKSKAKGKKSRPGDALKTSARQKISVVRTIAGAIAGISSALAAVLPKSIKGPFQEVANTIRSGQNAANNAMEKPKQLAASGEQLKFSAGRLKSTTTGKPGSKPAEFGSTCPGPVRPGGQRSLLRRRNRGF